LFFLCVLGLAVGLFTICAISLLLNVQLGRALNNVVPGSGDMNCGVLRIGVLLDGVATVGFDGDLALFLDLGNLAAGVA
jgi:hypothetical protein